VARNIYCPICGKPYISRYEANHPVGDFYCEGCESDFELKSKDGLKFPSKIADGAYETMIERITSLRNPNFFFLILQRFCRLC
jgi:type II restriction enzyme